MKIRGKHNRKRFSSFLSVRACFRKERLRKRRKEGSDGDSLAGQNKHFTKPKETLGGCPKLQADDMSCGLE